MRKSVLVASAIVTVLAFHIPSAAAVMHDDSCMNGAAGDAAALWPGAKPLSAAALGAAGCTSESINVGNNCGAGTDLSDWFYANILQPTVTVQASLSGNLFNFCGGAGLDVTLEIWFLKGGAALPDAWPAQAWPAITSIMPNPGTLVCSVNAAGLAAGETCAPVTITDALGGRVFVHKGVASGIAGANTLKVAVT
jgi:hypothetical protein